MMTRTFRTHILYLSSVSSPAQFQKIVDSQRDEVQVVTYGMPQSGNKFGTLIQSGLASDPSVELTALTGRAVHHRFHRHRFWARSREQLTPNWVIDHLSFPNAPGFRQLWLAAQVSLRALQWRFSSKDAEELVFIADAAYVTALPGALLALAGSRVRRVAIFADVYSYMGTVEDASDRKGIFFKLLRCLATSTYSKLDGFILLTEQMNAVVNPKGKPHLVMEGLVDANVPDEPDQNGKSEAPTILYAGALRREYGLADLIAGFCSYRNPEARLIIYGDGDYASAIKQAATADPRIEYRGNVPVEQVVKAEQAAWVLVNPRPIDHQFTRYSFPSKNMEYLASGSAVLTTRLPGMPAEYYDHVFTIDTPGASGIVEALERVIELGPEALQARGAAARRFVLDSKNHQAQAQRILAFARGLYQ